MPQYAIIGSHPAADCPLTNQAVRDFLFQGGFAHFLELDFHLVTPIEELLHHMDQLPRPIH